MLILSNDDVEKILNMQDCMTVLEQMYADLAAGDALFMPRVDNLMPCSHEGAYYGFKHMGGGWPRHNILALRINSDIVTHPRVGGRLRREKVPLAEGGRWVGLVELFNTETGELLAVFPDGVVQRMRVGATNGLGVRYLARKNAKRVGLIGSGWQAGGQLLAVLEARAIEEVKVYSIRRESREAFAAEMGRKTGAGIYCANSVEECVRDVDIIMSATSSLEPVIRAEWLQEGVHVSCIKSQEVDETVFNRFNRIVVHSRVQDKQTDHVLPKTENIPTEHLQGWWNANDADAFNFPDLCDLISGCGTGRTKDSEITCFVNNIGLGLQFAAVGALILKKAKGRDIGRQLPSEWFSESVHP